MEENNTILIVDDEAQVAESLGRLLQHDNYQVFSALSGEEGLEVLSKENVGVVISDLMMPKMDGITFFETVSRLHGDVIQILFTGHATINIAIEAINRLNVFGFFKKPWDYEELHGCIRRAFAHYNLSIENKRLNVLTKQQNVELREANETLEARVRERTQMLDEAIWESVLIFARMVETKDGKGEGHMHRVMDTVMDICRALELTGKDINDISLFSMVHDVGKVRVPDHILKKQMTALSAEDQAIRRNHTVYGEQIFGVKPFYKVAREITRSHHENWDGTGYPDGLQGKDIPLSARIVAVADVFDTLTNKPPYRDAWTTERVLKEIGALAGNNLDPDIAEAFLTIQQRKLRAASKSQKAVSLKKPSSIQPGIDDAANHCPQC